MSPVGDFKRVENEDDANRKTIHEGWLSRRLRMIRWKEWKNPRTRVRNLNSLGVRKDKAYEWGNSRKGYWRIAKSPILHKTLGKAYWHSRGLKSLTARYDFLRQT
ncbi:hypothetical protein SAMN05428981_105216 [Bacillus sp. OV194]|nr:hypothetical protein SAMN05428981_105216 [Bacillus sp. OV194]